MSNKRYRIKRFSGDDWIEVESIDSYLDANALLNECYRVAHNCKHDNTYNSNGVTKCTRCREVLEITSYRE